MLILYALGQYQKNNNVDLTYEKVREQLTNLLIEFGPLRYSYNPEKPFARLVQDGIWAAYYPQRERLGMENGRTVCGNYLPLTDAVLLSHLQEETPQVTVGIYPLLLDETCWFMAIDFDKSSWKEDTSAFLETCINLNVPAALERSRSGNGGHVWIFFSEPIPARTARKLGSSLLTVTLDKRHQTLCVHLVIYHRSN